MQPVMPPHRVQGESRSIVVLLTAKDQHTHLIVRTSRTTYHLQREAQPGTVVHLVLQEQSSMTLLAGLFRTVAPASI